MALGGVTWTAPALVRRSRAPLCVALALLTGMAAACSGSAGSGSVAAARSPAAPASQVCDDAEGPPAAQPPRAPSDAAEIFVGNGTTYFFGRSGARYRESVAYHQATTTYASAKLPIYTLESKPPSFTVHRLDGEGTGGLRSVPTTGGLPGPLPTVVYFSSPGCWEVSARGSSGHATIHVYVDSGR
jgi:hypothetical protein